MGKLIKVLILINRAVWCIWWCYKDITSDILWTGCAVYIIHHKWGVRKKNSKQFLQQVEKKNVCSKLYEATQQFWAW